MIVTIMPLRLLPMRFYKLRTKRTSFKGFPDVLEGGSFINLLAGSF